MRILLVEDHEDSRQAMAALLRLSGHVVIHVGTGGEAMAAVAYGQRYDVAVIDLGLPDMNGTELLTGLLANGPLIGIAVTGSTSAKDVADCKAAGFALHLPKPITIEDLEEALQQVSPDGG